MSQIPTLFLDNGSGLEAFRRDVLHGLRRQSREIPCKYLYDDRGSELFEEICELDEYYPTRTELGIMEEWVGEVAAQLGPACLVVEYGSGSSRKTRLLLDALEAPVAYVPIDISCDALRSSSASLAARYPDLDILPVCADYTEHIELPRSSRDPDHRVVYFPGSTIGNFAPAEATGFLASMADVAGEDGSLLIGVDLNKDVAVLERAYDDARGVTADFNRNLLARINRELGANFPLDNFRHEARYDPAASRVEMHLVAESACAVMVAGEPFHFEAGESIHTENSYKYDPPGFAKLAAEAGLRVRRIWTDADGLFSVQYLTAA